VYIFSWTQTNIQGRRTMWKTRVDGTQSQRRRAGCLPISLNNLNKIHSFLINRNYLLHLTTKAINSVAWIIKLSWRGICHIYSKGLLWYHKETVTLMSIKNYSLVETFCFCDALTGIKFIISSHRYSHWYKESRLKKINETVTSAMRRSA